MKVKILKHFCKCKPGMIVNVTKGVARLLMKQGKAEVYKEEETKTSQDKPVTAKTKRTSKNKAVEEQE